MSSSEILNGDENLSSTNIELDDTVELKKVNHPDLVEINDAFDNLEINPMLKSIAATNELNVTWQELQLILETLVKKQAAIMEDKIMDKNAKKDAEELALKIGHSINDHLNCPFTIQRLCELVIEPKKYYKMYIKYLRAVEKVLLVTSYWEDYAHPIDKDETMDESSSGENLLSSFNNCIELEPHNFVISEEVGEGDKHSKNKEEIITEQIQEETKKEIKEQFVVESIQSDYDAEKRARDEKDDEKDSMNTLEQEDVVIEKLEYTTAPSTPTDLNEDSKMDLD
ncbi:PPP4R2-domain-containing protein [Parasitella parasitica]|nr:PPP4R2-domain-containing protein [Parasitella parasitica]